MGRNEYITDQQVVKRVQAAIRIELEKKKALDRPAVVYDRQTKKIYHMNSDGSRTEIDNRLSEGRYSEQIEKKA